MRDIRAPTEGRQDPRRRKDASQDDRFGHESRPGTRHGHPGARPGGDVGLGRPLIGYDEDSQGTSEARRWTQAAAIRLSDTPTWIA